MATTPISLHLNDSTLDRLAARERETGQTREALAEQYLEEGLRMERHPGIFFQDGPSGRRPRLISGPDVWELVAEIDGLSQNDDAEIKAVGARMHIAERWVRSAISYYAEFRDEIDAWIDSNRRIGEEYKRQWLAERGLPAQ